jgi:hypothetical protein
MTRCYYADRKSGFACSAVYSGRSTADGPGGTIIISRGAGLAGAPPTDAPALTDVPTEPTWPMHFD